MVSILNFVFIIYFGVGGVKLMAGGMNLCRYSFCLIASSSVVVCPQNSTKAKKSVVEMGGRIIYKL
jgi:hypothetical protein